MRYSILYKAVFFLLVGSFLACEKDLEVKLPYEAPRFVLNGIFNANDSIRMSATKSRFITEIGELDAIADATIIVYEDGEEKESLEWVGEDLYVSKFVAKEGSAYEFKASGSGVKSVSANTTIPFAAKIENVKLDSTVFDGAEFFTLKFSLRDNSSSNFYNIQLLERLTTVDFFNDTVVYVNPINFEGHLDPVLEDLDWDLSRGASFNDNLFNGGIYEFSIRTLKNGDSFFEGKREFVVAFSTITEDQFKYDVAYSKYIESNDDPFSEPVQIPTNVENGLGLVAGKALNHLTIEIP